MLPCYGIHQVTNVSPRPQRHEFYEIGGPGRTLTYDQGIMSSPPSLFMCRKAEEPKTLFRWPFPSMTETELMPNPVVSDSERAEGKSKKGEGLWEPNSERLPSRDCHDREFLIFYTVWATCGYHHFDT